MRRRLLPALAAAGLTGPFLASRAALAQEAVTVFAAASLTDAMRALGQAWRAAGHPPPRFSFAASSALARQIEQGAPADLFASADEAWMDLLEERRLLLEGTRTSPLGQHPRPRGPRRPGRARGAGAGHGPPRPARPARAAGGGRPVQRAGGPLRPGSADLDGRLGRAGAAPRAGGQRALRPAAGGARGGAARDRLRDRRGGLAPACAPWAPSPRRATRPSPTPSPSPAAPRGTRPPSPSSPSPRGRRRRRPTRGSASFGGRPSGHGPGARGVGGGPAQPRRRAALRRLRAAARGAGGLAPGAGALSRAGAARRAGAPAAGDAAGRRRLAAAGDLRAARAGGLAAGRLVRRAPRLHHRRRVARHRRHVLPADRAGGAAEPGRGRSRAGGGGAHARRRAARPLRDGHAAADRARHPLRARSPPSRRGSGSSAR